MYPPESSALSDGSPTTPAHEAPGLRVLRVALAAGFAVALTFLLGLAVVGWSLTARAALEPLLQGVGKDADASSTALLFTAAFVLLTPTALLVILLRQRRFAWPVFVIGGAGTIAVLIWLAWDDPTVRRPLTYEELVPPFDGAERSFAVLMQYSKQHPSPEAAAFFAEKRLSPWSGPGAIDGGKWHEYITANRAALEADWEILAPQRRWWAELNASERIGDLTPPRFDADIINFQVWRTLSQHSCAIASLQALDGQGDAAIATLLPALQLGRKLQSTSRTLVRSMIGIIIEKMMLQTVAFVLDHTAISPASRAALAAELRIGNGSAGARHLILTEIPMMAAALARETPSVLFGTMAPGNSSPPTRGLLNALGPFLCNIRATVNLYADHMYELAALAETRQLDRLDAWSNGFIADAYRQRSFKNLGGRWLVLRASPAYTKVLQSYWTTQDLRVTVLARVTALLG